MNEEFVRKVFTNLKIETVKISFGGYIPPNVIGYAEKMNYNTVVWRTERQQVNMLFAEKTKLKSGKYAVPGLVWCFGSSLGLYAYKEWKGEDTELFCAPFYNVNQESVCLGSAASFIDRQEGMYSFKQIMQAVENGFWKSYFTHAGSTENVNGSFAGLFEKTFKATEYPYEYLVPLEETVKSLCNEIFST